MPFKPKFLILALMLLTSLSSHAQTIANPVITETKQAIICEASPEIFSPEWKQLSVFMTASSLEEADQIQTAVATVKQALDKYPTEFLKKYIKTVYIVKQLKLNDVVIGGAYWSERGVVYLNHFGGTVEWESKNLQESLHHEIGHLVFLHRTAKFSHKEWSRFNTKGFQYGKGGLETLKAGEQGNELNVNYQSEGFASRYAKSAIEEDFACLSNSLMSNDADFWREVEKYPVLSKKVAYTIKTYRNLDKAFTEPYFRGLPSVALIVQTFRYQPGDTLYFPKGGEVTLPSKAQGKSKILKVASGGLAVYTEGMGVVFYKEGKASTSPVVIPPDSEMHFLLDGAFVIRCNKADKVSLP